MDHIQLLSDIADLNRLFRDSVSVQTLFEKTVELIAEHTHSDVCSIYLYDDQSREIVLKATKGLNPKSVESVRMALGEGLTGTALQELRTICEKDAARNPNFKYFPGIFEERYKSFLAVPIARGLTRIGVLTVQRESGKKCFNKHDNTTLEAVASQLANIIENARFLMGMYTKEKPLPKPAKELKFVKGKVASEGLACAESVMIDKQANLAVLLKREYTQKYSIEQFEQAVARTAAQLEELQTLVEEKLSDAASFIFASHLLILKDHKFIGSMKELIESGVNAPEAVMQISGNYMQSFAASRSAYMQEKVQDIEDLIVRLMSNLVSEVEQIGNVRGKIVLARELFPSDILKLSSEDATGVVLVSGGVTSHVAILARSLRIPMVMANEYDLLDVPNGTSVFLDAENGNIYVDPSEEMLAKFCELQKHRLSIAEQKLLMKPVTNTIDGTQIHLMANINLLSDLKAATELMCEGIGLYRTEFPFMVRSSFPTETEQLTIYRKLVKGMAGKPVTFRTLDIGGDKVLSYYHDIKEQNPAMGMRSIRFSLANRDIFLQQIKAILRAGHESDLRIMFPMISSMDEFFQARDLVHEAMAELKSGGIRYNESPRIGMMVEVPSVMELIEDFAKEADFFSIGTNDFVQFMLGVDRTNQAVSQFYLPHHPAVLRSLAKVAAAGMKYGKDVSICGDIPGSKEYLAFLIGIGIRRFSMDPGYILRTQQTINKIELEQAENFAQTLLSKSSVSDINSVLNSER